MRVTYAKKGSRQYSSGSGKIGKEEVKYKLIIGVDRRNEDIPHVEVYI